MSITSLRIAVTAAGGIPSSFTRIGALRQLLAAKGGTPNSHTEIALLRALITLAGGSPMTFQRVGLLREYVTALGGVPATYYIDALEAQIAGLAGGVVVAGNTWAAATDTTRTNGNLTVERTAGTQFWAPVYSTTSKDTGSWTATINALNGAAFQCFVGFSDGLETGFPGQANETTGISYRDNGEIRVAGGLAGTAEPYTVGDAITCERTALDTFVFKKNGVTLFSGDLDPGNVGYPPLTSANLFAAFCSGSSTPGSKVTANFSGW